jgi:hypothetical protein
MSDEDIQFLGVLSGVISATLIVSGAFILIAVLSI